MALVVGESGLSAVTAELDSSLLSYQSGGGEEQSPADVDSESKERFFDEELIDWSWLNMIDVDADVNVAKIDFNGIEIGDFHLPIESTDGRLNVTALKGLLGGGEFSSDVTLTEVDDAADIVFDLTASGVILEKLNFLPPEDLRNAATDLTVSLKTKGQHSLGLVSALDGSVLLNVGDGIIGNDSFELLGSDLILGLLNKLNPFAKKDKTTELECAVVKLNIEQGKINIDNSLALRTSKLTMVADGSVDLPSEKIKLSLTPKARQGVGVDVSSLVKFIALGGTLSEPAPTVSAAGLIQSAAVVGAAVSTGGVSLLATSVAEKTIAKVDVCKRANAAFD